MANLTRTYQWQRYVPDLGDNRELPRPFFLRVASGLSLVQLAELETGFKGLDRPWESTAELAAHLALLFAPYVVFGDEPLTLEGKPIETLQGYLELIIGLAGQRAFLELFETIRSYNTFTAKDALFSGRPSGGNGTTAHQTPSALGPPP